MHDVVGPRDVQVLPADSAAKALDAVIARTAIVFRCMYCATAPVTALAMEAPPGSAVWRNWALAVVLLWGGVVFWVCRSQRRLPRWLVVVDAAIFTVFALYAGWLVPRGFIGDGATWVAAALSVSMLLVAWALSRWQAVLAAVVETAAFAGGVAVAGLPVDATVALTGVVYPIQLVLGLFVVRFMKRTATAADNALVALEKTRRTTAIEQARIEDADKQRLALHDTILTTLTAVARGCFAGNPCLLRRRAQMDLSDLSEQALEQQTTPATAAGVGATAQALAEVRGISLTCHLSGDAELPPGVASAMIDCIREGLSNIEKHAGVDHAVLDLHVIGDEVAAMLRDTGRGFSTSERRSPSIGRASIEQRMRAIGGHAQVLASPGQGTSIVLRWRPSGLPQPASAGEPFDHLLTDAYATGLARALTYVAFLWHLITLVQFIPNFANYRWPGAAIGSWIALLAVGIWLLRQRPASPVSAKAGIVALAVILCASSVAVLTCQGEGLTGKANWALGGFGWFLVAMAAHRSAREIVIAWLVIPAVDLWAVYVAFDGGRSQLGHSVGILVFVTNLQVGALIMYVILRRHGRTAAAALQAVHQLNVAQAARQAVSRDRAVRYHNLEATLLPLVRSIADGTADPDTLTFQNQAWVAAAVLRALLEHDVDNTSRPTIDSVVSVASTAAKRDVAAEVRIDELEGLPAHAVASLTAVLTAWLDAAQPGAATIVVRNMTDHATATVCMKSILPLQRLKEVASGPIQHDAINLEVINLDGDKMWMEAQWTR